MRIQVSCEFMMRFPNDAGEGLEIAYIKTTTGSFDENFVKEWLDNLALCLFDIVSSKAGESSCNHVPCRDGFLGIKISWRGSEWINAQREAFASKWRPNSDFAIFKQFALTINIAIPLKEFRFINSESKTSQVTLWVNDQRWNTSKGCFLNQCLGHNRFSRTCRAEHSGMSSEDCCRNVNWFTRVSTFAQKKTLWFEFLFRCSRDCGVKNIIDERSEFRWRGLLFIRHHNRAETVEVLN